MTSLNAVRLEPAFREQHAALSIILARVAGAFAPRLLLTMTSS